MAKSNKLSRDSRRYYAEYRSIMRERERCTSMRERLRAYLYAIADPSCPLHEHVRSNSPPSFDFVYETLAPSGRETKNAWRAEMLRWDGEHGLLRMRRPQFNCRLAIPDDEQAKQIKQRRQQLEADALVAVHQLPQPAKQKAIYDLKFANENIFRTARLAEKCFEKTDVLREVLWLDPEAGGWAEAFWAWDRKFHFVAAQAVGMLPESEKLGRLLDLSRLKNANRLTIISRFSRSYQEHRRIIEAVAADVQTDSAEQVKLAVAAHLDSSERDFETYRQSEAFRNSEDASQHFARVLASSLNRSQFTSRQRLRLCPRADWGRSR